MIGVQAEEAKTKGRTGSRRFYRPELDVVRFLAFGSVFLHHQMPRSLAQEQVGILGRLTPSAKIIIAGTGNAFGFGLPLFFMLSAYLIGTLLLQEKERTGIIDLRAFYTRRILRIWPLYLFGLILGSAIAVFIDKRPHDLLLFGTFFLMIGNWTAIIWHTSNPFMPLWSISVEEQFYLFCPVMIRTLSVRGLYIFSVMLIALSDLTLCILGQMHADADRTIWYNSFAQFQMFGGGLLLCLWLRRREVDIPMGIRFLCLAGGFTCWFIACFAFGAKQMAPAVSGAGMVVGYTIGAGGCLAIIVGMLGTPRRWLPSWIIWLGRVSFGLYVYHDLALKISGHATSTLHGYEHFVLSFFGAGTLTVIFAALSYRFLEAPFLRMKERYEVVPGRPA